MEYLWIHASAWSIFITKYYLILQQYFTHKPHPFFHSFILTRQTDFLYIHPMIARDRSTQILTSAMENSRRVNMHITRHSIFRTQSAVLADSNVSFWCKHQKYLNVLSKNIRRLSQMPSVFLSIFFIMSHILSLRDTYDPPFYCYVGDFIGGGTVLSMIYSENNAIAEDNMY